jgi:hypothetical protein
MSGKFNFEIEQQRFDERRLSAEPKLELVGWVSDKAVRLLALGANVHADIYTCEAPGCVPLYAAPPEPDAKPVPATETQVTKAYIAEGTKDWWSDWKAGWRAAERHHGIRATEQQPGAAGMSAAEADRVLTDALRKPCRYPACQDADGRCPRIFAGECSGPGGVVA